VIGNLSSQLAPIIIIAAAVFWTKAGQDLSVAEVFTSLSIVTLVSRPLVNIIGAYPTFVASLACFRRIQTFLLSDERSDYRSVATMSRSPPARGDSTSRRDMTSGDIELEIIPTPDFMRGSEGILAIRIVDASFTFKKVNEVVLRNISISIPKSSITMIVGPVGSGKSALLKSILGECRILNGSVQLSCGSVAYCDQTAWLRWGSVRENILGPNGFEDTWYKKVLYACALNEDIAQLKEGDQSLVGDGGIALSGGQKQRVVCGVRSGFLYRFYDVLTGKYFRH
jgi:ATP-binding cassette subfamily C (CFTR/MRP) protein 1